MLNKPWLVTLLTVMGFAGGLWVGRAGRTADVTVPAPAAVAPAPAPVPAFATTPVPVSRPKASRAPLASSSSDSWADTAEHMARGWRLCEAREDSMEKN